MIIEQAELRDAARKMLAGMTGASSDEAWSRITQAGWPSLTAPESLGGLEQSLTACCWLYLELGSALSPVPLLSSLLATATLGACAPSPARDQWIERIVNGQRLAVPLLHPAPDWHLRAVLGACRATHTLVTIAGEALIAIAALDRLPIAVPRPTWDATRELSDLDVSALAADDMAVIARGAAAEAGLAAFATHLHVAIAADCIGAAAKILSQTVAHLQVRRQFDRPLAMFQALKHRCADLHVTVLAAEALLMDYLPRIEAAQGAERVRLARAAKSIASGAFRAVAEDAVQLHGGMGMAFEHPCHLYLKRALLNEVLASPNDDCDIAVSPPFAVASDAVVCAGTASPLIALNR